MLQRIIDSFITRTFVLFQSNRSAVFPQVRFVYPSKIGLSLLGVAMKVYSAISIAFGLFIWLVIAMMGAQWAAGLVETYIGGAFAWVR